MYRPAVSMTQVIPAGNPRQNKQNGTFRENTPHYYCYGSIYITYHGTHDDARIGGMMKFTCNTKDIASAVGAASKVVNAHTTVPILSNVLLAGRGG